MRLLKYLINELVSIIFAVLVAVLIFLALRHYVLQPFQVEGSSMEPQLHNQDQMVMLRNKDIERYDVVVFPDPRGSGDSYVKRIIGEPGDEIYFSNDTLYLNNQPVEEPYLEPLKSETEGKFTEDFSLWDTLGLTQVPDDYYFVMGDNRPYSGDSRQFGLIQAEDIQGVTNFVYFPFERFGKIEEYNLTENGTVNILE
ncbi:signal peptidase I [Ruoffia tabacinasalis]|uniref:signal peptidase I n=1 Tax=Ruoffia tabacinasalis TaxID=87458 RepID=UPI003F980055